METLVTEQTGVSVGLVVAVFGVMLVLMRGERAERRAIEDKLDELRLHVEREFVPHRTLELTETRLIAAMDKLGTRLETMIARLDTLATDVAAALGRGDRD